MLLDGKARDRLAGFRDAVHDPAGPGRLDADDDAGGHIGVRSRADQRAEEQLEILTELQPAVGVGQRQGALDVVRHRFARGVRKVVERQDDYMIANADASVFTPYPWKS